MHNLDRANPQDSFEERVLGDMMAPTTSKKDDRADRTQGAELRKSLHELLQASAALHNHLCPRQVLGVRMGMWAGELLALELPQADKRLLVIVESDGCFADGVAVATNCWIGRRTLRVEDYGKAAATFVDTQTGSALRITPQANVRELAQAIAPEASDRWEAMLLGYQRLEAELLFRVERVSLRTPLTQIISRPGLRRSCDRCGEEIINEREFVVGQEALCQACAGHAYYRRNDSRRDPAFDYVLPDLPESSITRHPPELLALFDSSQEIVAQLDLDTLLGTIANQVRALVQAEAAFLCLLTPGGDALQLAFSSGWDEIQVGVSQSSAHGLAAQVVGGGSTVVATAQCANCAILNKFGSCGCIAVPLRAGKSTLGALCVVRARGRGFDAGQAQSLRMLANAAAIALTNARLADTARQEAAHAAASAEREHLSAELHDNLAQTLAFLKLKVNVLEMRLQETIGTEDAIKDELAAMAAAIATAYTQTRTALTGLQQPHMPSNNLAGALEQSVAEFNATTGITAKLVIADEAALTISAIAQSQVKYIVHEALTNIRRHAQAGNVQVRAEQRDGLASFVIVDDGCGFEPYSVDIEHHLGLAIMHRRATQGGGRLIVHSSPGAGTQVVVSFPMDQKARQEREDGR